MKQKFSIHFPAVRRKRGIRGQYLAAAALLLTLTAVGTASLSLTASQPQALEVQPAVVHEQPPVHQAAVDWRPAGLTPAAPAAEELVEAAPAQPDLPPQEPEAAPPPAAPEQPAEPVSLEPSTPALAAEDQENTARFDALEATNGQETAPAEADGAEPEGLVPIDGPDGEIVLLTPEQLGAAGINPEDEAALEDENCLLWLLEYLFGIKHSGWYSSFGSTYYYDPQTHEKVTGVQTIDGKLYCFDASGVMQKNVTFGIDVSRYQQNLDWAKVREAGAEFAIIRIGYRGYESGTLVLDPMYEAHMAGATAAGLRVGVYFFSQAVNEAEAVEEAEACLYVLDVLGHSLQYPIYFDSEYATSSRKGRADGLTREQRTACAAAFCDTIQAAGQRAGVYASTNWFKDKLDFAALSRYSIWNAHYGVAESPLACELWQGSCTGQLGGIPGQLDLNVSYIG